MSLRSKLTQYAGNLGRYKFSEVCHSENAGFILDRIYTRTPEGDFLMVHRFYPDPQRRPFYVHGHGDQAQAIHILGPSQYETGFVQDGVCVARLLTSAPAYYEMRVGELQHYVRPLGLLYTIGIWTSEPNRVEVPSELAPIETGELLETVKILIGG